MNTTTMVGSLGTLLGELVDGTPPTGGYMLNLDDPGLLRSLERITAAEASVVHNEGGSIAAHVRHVTYGISLMNKWAQGENPWHTADWAASWRQPAVTEDSWKRTREALADELHRWLAVVKQPRDMDERELTGMIGSIAHLAYHLGAIRQMNRALRGPSANNELDAFTAPATRP